MSDENKEFETKGEQNRKITYSKEKKKKKVN